VARCITFDRDATRQKSVTADVGLVRIWAQDNKHFVFKVGLAEVIPETDSELYRDEGPADKLVRRDVTPRYGCPPETEFRHGI
jgi:hypothetical protein